MKFLFSPIVTFLQSTLAKMSALDGKPGLSVDDITQLVQRVVTVQKAFAETSGADRAYKVTDWVRRTFAEQIPTTGKWSWVPDVLSFLAYLIAQRKGKI